MTMIEQVRKLADERTADDEELVFYPYALELGCSEKEAEKIDIALTTRVMRAAGAI